MSKKDKPDMALLHAIHGQIEEICKNFKAIRGEAKDIVNTSQMPDATLHLNDVLQSTEEAITTIIEAATAIGYIGDGEDMPPEAKQKIADQVSRIYEACSFQDISGQRIKKVLAHMNALEGQLLRLSETARGPAEPVKNKPGSELLNGPQLSGQAPTQQEVDQMFLKSK